MKMWKTLSLLLFLGACGFTPQGTVFRDAIKTSGAQAYDEGLANATWYICNAASIGSARRAFGARADLYRQFCEASGADLFTHTQ